MFNGIINLIGIPLGWIMKLIYNLAGNYGIAIVLFTLVTKLILLPVTYKQQKNSARMQLLNPKMKALREKYANKPEKMQLETTKLYQEENINPYSSCLTSFIPLLLLWGVLAVVYKPMTYILDYNSNVIEEAKAIVISIDDDKKAVKKTLESNTLRQELVIMEKMLQNPDAFIATIQNGKATILDDKDNEVEIDLASIDVEFVPIVSEFADTFTIGNTNLSETPTFKLKENSTFFLFMIPILSGLMQLVLTIYMQIMQKKRNPDMPDMGAMNIMLFGMPLFSVWLAFTVPAGVGFYWICSSGFSFIQTVLLYAWFNEKRVQKIGEAERKKAQKANRRPSMMQRMLEQQEELLRQQEGGSAARLSGGPANRVRYSDDDGQRRLSRSEMEEYNTAVIREARRRMAEKYGEEPEQPAENPKKKKK